MPIIDLSSQIADGAEQLAGPFGSLFRKKQFPSSDEFGKRFVSAQKVSSGGGNGVTYLDDPTYLGFTLLFDRTSALFNGALIGSPSPPNSTFNVDNIPGPLGDAIQFLNENGLTGAANTLANNANNMPNASEESAVGYLTKIGETTRATYLRAFVQGLFEINSTRPYYWQTVEGLTEAWTAMSEINDPYTGVEIGGKEGITIGCLEAIDLKISALFTLYKLAVYDMNYKRYILPRNLMNFDVTVFVSEIRKFKTVKSFLRSIAASVLNEDDTIKYVNQNVSQIGFKFTMCNWIPEACGKVFESVTNAGGNTFASTSIKWAYSNIQLDSQFSGYDSKLMSEKSQGASQFGVKEAVAKFAKSVVGNAVEGAISAAERRAKSIGQSLLFGNVYGFSPALLATRLTNINPEILLNAANGAAVQVAEFVRNRSRRGLGIGDNPLGDGIQPARTLPNERLFTSKKSPRGSNLGTGNIFGTGPSGPSPLESTNVFG